MIMINLKKHMMNSKTLKNNYDLYLMFSNIKTVYNSLYKYDQNILSHKYKFYKLLELHYQTKYCLIN